jgi:hypothetical protein
VETAEARSETGALAPKMLLYDNPGILNSMGLECSMIASSWDLGIGRLDGPRWEKASPVIGVCGGAAFFRVEALRRAGLLPSDFDIYLDDLDLSLRIWNAGYEIRSCPESRVRHKFGATMGTGRQYRRKYYLNTRNRLYILSRNFPASRWISVMAACGVGEARAVGRALLDREPWRAAAHVRAWGGGLGYLPRAVRERRRRRRAGQAACRFWHLVRKDCMFFRGTEFPVDGWYAERIVRGKKTRPMSALARMDVAPGRLRVTLVNCYPRLGNAGVDVSLNGQPVALLETPDSPQTVLDVPPGVLEFKARRVFEAEETGELVDVGGWIALERL